MAVEKVDDTFIVATTVNQGTWDTLQPPTPDTATRGCKGGSLEYSSLYDSAQPQFQLNSSGLVTKLSQTPSSSLAGSLSNALLSVIPATRNIP